MPKSAFSDDMQSWGHLADSMVREDPDLPHLQPHLTSLQEALAAAWDAKHRQLELRAAAQQATRDLETAMAKAQDAATRLHTGLLGAYGTKSAKLIAFGMRPHRSAKLHPSLADTAPAVPATAAAGGNVPQSTTESAAAAAAPLPARGTMPQSGPPLSIDSGGVARPGREGAHEGRTGPRPAAPGADDTGASPAGGRPTPG